MKRCFEGDASVEMGRSFCIDMGRTSANRLLVLEIFFTCGRLVD